jgi:hypothetical protein
MVQGQPEQKHKTLAKQTKVAGPLMPVILATQEAEIKRIVVQTQPRQFVRPYLKKSPSQKKKKKKRAGGVGPEYKPQYCKQNTKVKKGLGVWLKRKNACLGNARF